MVIQKYMRLKQLFYLLLLCSFATCQYPIDSYVQATKKRFLLINADLTDSYGKVTVEYSVDEITITNVYTTPPEVKAEIYVEDSKGVKVPFTNKIENKNFRGVVGETYKLFVNADGKTYESSRETMPKCPEIDSISAAFKQDLDYPASNPLRNAFDVYVYAQDYSTEGNYYQWDWVHYSRNIYCGTANYRGSPASLPCATDCWNIGLSEKINVLADKLVNGQNMRIAVDRIPYQSPPRYYLKIEQRGISKTAFNYFKSLEKQTQSNGSLFDVPAQTLFSPNIKGITDPTEKILGLFNVFSSRKKIIYVDMTQEIPGVIRRVTPNEFPPYPYPYPSTPPCVEGPYRTRIKPEGWVE